MGKLISKLVVKLRKHIPLNGEFRNEFKRAILTLQITFIAIFAIILFFTIDIIYGNYISAIQSAFAFLVFSTSIYLITIGKLNIGKILILLISCITLTINASRDGRTAGNEFIWFPIFGGIFLFFASKDKEYIITIFFIAISCIVFLEITDYSYLLKKNNSSEYNYINFFICFSTSIVLISLFMYYLKKINSESERKLERLNAILHSRNNKLRKTNNELDSFVYKASHDMRAPLTSLLGLIEICKKETDLKILGSFLELQEKSIQKLDSYIADILNISRNARVEIEIKQIDFNTMFEQLFEQLSFMDKASLVNKSIKIYHTVPFYSDPIRLNIVLNNLISNSIRYADFSKANPEINVLVKINTEQAEITITDNGIGIDNEHLTKVFNMFYRATESNSGSGLGLYIVKETIEKLNGKINMTSNLGLGTEIKIVLPNIQK